MPTLLLQIVNRPQWSLRLLWEPRDMWVGVYWTRDEVAPGVPLLTVYVCVVPCLPIRLCAIWRNW
jgi:hypothetical protein